MNAADFYSLRQTKREIKVSKHREIAYALLRLTLGIVFLFAGIGKFRGGLGNFAGGMLQQFSGKLPAVLVEPFAYTLPFAETTLGALILLGLFTPGAYFVRAAARGPDFRHRDVGRLPNRGEQRSVRISELHTAVAC